jgi:hypothetical protein
MEIFDWILTHKEVLASIVTTIVTLASLVASLTPTPKDDTLVGKAYKVVDLLALNIGRAKEVNATAVEKKENG